MKVDVTKLTQGQLIRLCDDLGMSKDEIAYWVTERQTLLTAKETLSSIEKTLNDPVVLKAQRIAQEAMRRKQLIKSLLGTASGIAFWGFLFWLVVNRSPD